MDAEPQFARLRIMLEGKRPLLSLTARDEGEGRLVYGIQCGLGCGSCSADGWRFVERILSVPATCVQQQRSRATR